MSAYENERRKTNLPRKEKFCQNNSTHDRSWDRFIASIENDVHGHQVIAYKLLRTLIVQIGNI